MTVTLPEIERNPVVNAEPERQPLVFRTFRRRVLPLLHKNAHQHERHKIGNPDHGIDPRQMIRHRRHHPEIEHQLRNHSPDIHRRHITPDETMRNHIGKNIIINRTDNQVEELKKNGTERKQQNAECLKPDRRQKTGAMQEFRNLRRPSEQDHESGNERSRRHKKRNPPAPPCACPVTGRRKNRIHYEIHCGRNAPDDQSDRRSGSIELRKRERQHRRHHHPRQQPETASAENQPEADSNHSQQRIAQCPYGIRARRIGFRHGRSSAGCQVLFHEKSAPYFAIRCAAARFSSSARNSRRISRKRRGSVSKFTMSPARRSVYLRASPPSFS